MMDQIDTSQKKKSNTGKDNSGWDIDILDFDGSQNKGTPGLIRVDSASNKANYDDSQPAPNFG